MLWRFEKGLQNIPSPLLYNNVLFMLREGGILSSLNPADGRVLKQGRALRLVVIDKLPFAAPGDPVFEAKLDTVRRRGGKPFFELQLPEAIVMLRQGAGRLIRDPGDRGLLMLCDPRVTSKGYGRQVLASLPAMPVLRDLDAAREFVKTL